VLRLVLLSPRDMGGRDTAVFEVFADAYSARRGATLRLSGLDSCRLGRSLLVVVENLPRWTFFLTGCVKPSSVLSVPVGGVLSRHLGELNRADNKYILVLKSK
jgi:hypothetical protein